MYVEPVLPRFQLAYNGGAMRVVIPTRCNWLMIVFMCAWLGVWSAGLVNAGSGFPHHDGRSSSLPLLPFLAIWTMAAGSILLTVLWQLFGKERLTIDSGGIAYRVEIFGLGRTRSYAISQVTGLRTVDFATGLFNNKGAWKLPFFGNLVGPIAFDYGARTIRMAPSLDEAEARLLLARWKECLPASVWL